MELYSKTFLILCFIYNERRVSSQNSSMNVILLYKCDSLVSSVPINVDSDPTVNE